MGAGIDEIDEAGPAVEFGEEHGGVGLRHGGLDPLEARPDGAIFGAAFPEDSAPIAAHSDSPSQSYRERERESM